MTDKKFKKFSRTELLEMLLIQTQEVEELEKKLSNEKTEKQQTNIPDSTEIEKELDRQKHKRQYGKAIRSTIYALITVAAVAVLAATLWLPVFRIVGESMNPTLVGGDIVVSVKKKSMKQGDLVAFYYNNKILVKRAIAFAGDWVDIDEEGNVYVNEKKIEEPYVVDKAYGQCNIELPYQVPESSIFVMGDNRSVSVDSRNTAVGCIEDEKIVGKLILRVWPFPVFGVL